MKKTILIPVLVCAVLVAAAGVLYYEYYYKNVFGGHPNLAAFVKGNETLQKEFSDALKNEQKIQQNAEDVASYLSLGLNWKSIAEQSTGTARTVFFKQSLSVYEQGVEKFGQKNILFYLNAGNVATALGDYEKAERYYRSIITLSPGDESGYRALAELYMYQMHKDPADVVAVYDEGVQKMFAPIQLIWSRGSYLYRIKRYADAKKDYEILVGAFPQNQGYKDILADINAHLK